MVVLKRTLDSRRCSTAGTELPPNTLDRLALRQRLRNTDRVWGAAMTQITAKVVARTSRSPIPRPEMLIDLARDWRAQIPEHGRFDLTIDAPDKRSLIIREMRAGACNVHSPRWPDTAEPGVSVHATVLHLAPHRHEFTLAVLAGVSLHALGRRY